MLLMDANVLIDEIMDEGTDFEKMTPGDLVDEILRLAANQELETEKAIDGLLEENDKLRETIAELRKINAELAEGYQAEEDAAAKNNKRDNERNGWVSYGKEKGLEAAIIILLDYLAEVIDR